MSQILQHKHLIFRIETPTPPKDVDFIAEWMKDLIKKVGMELYAGPIVKYLDEPGNRGATGVCIIKTSHIAIHIWDEPNPGLIEFDIYTCGCLDIQTVIDHVGQFNPSKIEYMYLDREFGLNLVEKR